MRVHGAEATELRRLAAMIPDLIRSGLEALEPGGYVSLVVTATRAEEADPRIRLRVVLTPHHSVECGSLIVEILRTMKGPRAGSVELEDDDRAFLEDVIGQIVLRLDDAELDVARLARAVHTSPSQLRRKLRAMIDRSPAEVIRIVRLLRARELMGHPNGSLSSIAHACGFSDQAHFSRTFRRYFGCSPSSCRRA